MKYNGKIVDAFLSFTAVYPAGSHVLTNDGEEAIVVSQNKDFQDRPIIRIIRDKDGRKLQEERIVDLVKVLNVYIEKGLAYCFIHMCSQKLGRNEIQEIVNIQ